MKPLDKFPIDDRRRITGVFTDIDETLTTNGRLTAQAYAALEALQSAGFLVVPITGRPAGWCDHIARMWPVDAVVGENGAFYFRYDAEKGELTKRFLQSDAEREANRTKLASVRDDILRQVPGTAVASDQRYREADLAIDFCEDVPPLPDHQIDRIVDIFTAAGATAKVSSIHVNGWFGDYDKLGMTRTLMSECFGVDLDALKDRFVFIGDSPNDAPMFDFFPHSVGVRNVMKFGARLTSEPTYVTAAESGAGFAQVVSALCADPNS